MDEQRTKSQHWGIVSGFALAVLLGAAFPSVSPYLIGGCLLIAFADWATRTYL